MVFVTRWANEGMTGLGADLVNHKVVNALDVYRQKVAAPKSSTNVGRAGSTHRSSGGAPPPPPLTTSNITTDYGQPSPRFVKGSALAPDTTRVDAGSGEGAYNPSNPMDRLRAQVSQAAYNMWRKSNPTATTPPSDITPSVAPAVVPITNPLTSTGGGGGGGGDTSSDTTPPDAPTGFWDSLSTIAKVGIVVGGLAVVGGGLYFFTRKRGGGAAPSHKS